MNNSRIQANLMSTSHIKQCQISKRSQESTVPESPHQSPPRKKHLASSSVAVLAMPGDQTSPTLVLCISKFELLHTIIHESKSSGMLKLWQLKVNINQLVQNRCFTAGFSRRWVSRFPVADFLLRRDPKKSPH